MKKILWYIPLVFSTLFLTSFSVHIICKYVIFETLSIHIHNHTGSEFFLTVTVNDSTIVLKNSKVEKAVHSRKKQRIKRLSRDPEPVFLFQIRKDGEVNFAAEDELRQSDGWRIVSLDKTDWGSFFTIMDISLDENEKIKVSYDIAY